MTFFCAEDDAFPENSDNSITASESHAIFRKKDSINVRLVNKELRTSFYLGATLSPVLEKKKPAHISEDQVDGLYYNRFTAPTLKFEEDSHVVSWGLNYRGINDFSDIDTHIKNSFREIYDQILKIPFYQRPSNPWHALMDIIAGKTKHVYPDPMTDIIIKHAQDNFDEDEQNAYYDKHYTVSETSPNVRVPHEFLTYEILEGPLHCILLPKQFGNNILTEEGMELFLKYEVADIDICGFSGGDIRIPKYRLKADNPKGLRDWFVFPYDKRYLLPEDDSVIFCTNSALFFKTKEDALSFRKKAIENIQRTLDKIA